MEACCCSMEDNQRRSQRPRSRKEDPDFLFIADMDMPRLKNLDSAYQAAVAASLAASQPQPSDSRAKQRAYTSLNSHPASSKAHHIDSTSFTRELGLLPSCKRRRSVCEAAMAMSWHHQSPEELDQPSGEQYASPDQQQHFEAMGLHDRTAHGTEANEAKEAKGRGGMSTDPKVENPSSSWKLPLQDASDQSSSDQLLLLKQHESAIQLKHHLGSPGAHLHLVKPAGRSTLVSRSFRRKGKPHRSAF